MSKKLGIFNNEKDATKAIVASNLVLAAAIMDAAGKTPTGGSPFLPNALEEAVKAFNSCVSLLKDEG